MDDTPRHIRKLQIEGYQALPIEKRVAIWAGLVGMTRQLTWQGIKQRHPQEDETKWRRRYAGLMVGEELATKFLGPLEEE